uniref:Uncharacterized protein n=1 Tax=Arundo donax TaxID=35708 RepID=A0A0A9HCA8_ARUDO
MSCRLNTFVCISDLLQATLFFNAGKVNLFPTSFKLRTDRLMRSKSTSKASILSLRQLRRKVTNPALQGVRS